MTSNKVINAEQKINKMIKDVHVAQTDYWKEQICVLNDKLKETLWLLFMDGIQLLQGQCHIKEAVYVLPISF